MIPSTTGAYFFGCAGPTLSAPEAAFFADAKPLGFILFARNVADPDQLRALTDDLRAAVGWAAPILIDQEGGRVQRLRAPHWREYLPALDQIAAAGPAHAARSMYLRARLIAAELHAVGIDVNCTPLADLTTDQTHPVLRNRTYGETLETAVEIARAVAQGCLDGGVLPVLKHIPGHGRASLDSHVDLPSVDTPAATLHSTDFAAFRALNTIKLGMSAHIVYTDIDPMHPATTSPKMQQIIRGDIGFDGLLMTDDISMGALPGTMADKCAAALTAGCDAILHCNGDWAEMQTVAATSGPLTPAAQARATTALAQRAAPAALDITAAAADLKALLKDA